MNVREKNTLSILPGSDDVARASSLHHQSDHARLDPYHIIRTQTQSPSPTMAATVPCPHLPQIASLALPRLSQQVHREECTQCFDNQVCWSVG